MIGGTPLRATVLAAFVSSACASERASVSGHGPTAGSLDASRHRPSDAHPVKLTLWRFWDVTDDATQDATPLDDVRVCVIKARPFDGTWNDFEDVHDTCSTSVSDGRIMIDGVPPLSELIVTAEKDGYRGSVYAVTTGQWDLDTTAIEVADLQRMQLRGADRWLRAGAPVSADTKLGDLTFMIAFQAGNAGANLGGATVALHGLEDDAGPGADGPFYFYAGTIQPDATETFFGRASSQRTRAGALFVNVPEGEYRVKVRHPEAVCWVFGAGSPGGMEYVGYASNRLNEVRAPVLLGHSTAFIMSACTCSRDVATPGAVEAGVCPALPDAAPL